MGSTKVGEWGESWKHSVLTGLVSIALAGCGGSGGGGVDASGNDNDSVSESDGGSVPGVDGTSDGLTLFLGAYDTSNGYELWRSTGASGETGLLKDINGSGGSSSPTQFVQVGDDVFFIANTAERGEELWRTDGTAGGTNLVKDIYPGPESSYKSAVSSAIAFQSRLYFVADDGESGLELWRSDGTEEGTVLVKDINPGPENGFPDGADARGLPFFTVYNDRLYFKATDGESGLELWSTDGTTDGTEIVKDIYAGSDGSVPFFMVEFDGLLYFSATDQLFKRQLWRTDGTSDNTIRVTDISANTTGFAPACQTIFDGELYCKGYDYELNFELWRTDGVTTTLVKDINTDRFGGSNPGGFFVLGDWLYFTASDGIHGARLWRTDGSDAGTRMVFDLNSGSDSSAPFDLTAFNGDLYFKASDGVSGNEVWVADGQTGGIRLLKDINPAGDASPADFTVFDGHLYFSASDGGPDGIRLWRTDGSEAGTVPVKDAAGRSIAQPFSLFVAH